MLLLFLFLYVSWAVISLKYSASNHYDHYLLHLPLSPFNSLSLTNFHYYYYHDLYLLDLSLSTVMGHCICHAWQCTLLWGNSCTHYPLTQHWVDLRALAENQPTNQPIKQPRAQQQPLYLAKQHGVHEDAHGPPVSSVVVGVHRQHFWRWKHTQVYNAGQVCTACTRDQHWWPVHPLVLYPC